MNGFELSHYFLYLNKLNLFNFRNQMTQMLRTNMSPLHQKMPHCIPTHLVPNINR